MFDFVREAGWPVYPTLLLSLGCLVVALRHAIVPQRSLLPLVIGLGAAALIMGLLGTTLGVQQSARGLPEIDPSQRWIFLIGLKEALGCLSAALAPTLLATLFATVGSWRMTSRMESIDARRTTP